MTISTSPSSSSNARRARSCAASCVSDRKAAVGAADDDDPAEGGRADEIGVDASNAAQSTGRRSCLYRQLSPNRHEPDLSRYRHAFRPSGRTGGWEEVDGWCCAVGRSAGARTCKKLHSERHSVKECQSRSSQILLPPDLGRGGGERKDDAPSPLEHLFC